MKLTAHTLKASLPPIRYYGSYLNGSIGKATGKDWHQWNGLCPFHNDRKPGSLVINKTTGAYKCFSCGVAGGDIIAFHMKANSLSFRYAFKQLQEGVQ